MPGLPLWLHTGDMATWDEEEFLVIVDRRKEIIISGGENISSLEIEKHIGAHPAVFECAVVAAPDPQWGEIPVAVVVLKTDERLTKEELLAFLWGAAQPVQVAPPRRFRARPVAQNRHRKDQKDGDSRALLGRPRKTHPRLVVCVRNPEVNNCAPMSGREHR